ncbi:MAG TPA: amidohydrolase family protein [Vicinamibacterales bacterium]|nr:amidohydrolase family protein [Vicinamibacterales bacterium]
MKALALIIVWGTLAIPAAAQPPGVVYLGASGYRARMHSALTIEEVVVKHPKLPLYIMHAGYPMIGDLLAVLHAHPQVYVDVGIIDYNLPKAAFYPE